MTEPKRVLVVEDEPAVAMLLVDCLEDEGYDVQHAGDGVEALEVLERWLPDVIVLDLALPRMNGHAFRTAQRGLIGPRGRVPAVVVSASRLTPDEVARLEAAAFIRKPFDLDEFAAAVAEAADGRSPTGSVRRQPG